MCGCESESKGEHSVEFSLGFSLGFSLRVSLAESECVHWPVRVCGCVATSAARAPSNAHLHGMRLLHCAAAALRFYAAPLSAGRVSASALHGNTNHRDRYATAVVSVHTYSCTATSI